MNISLTETITVCCLTILLGTNGYAQKKKFTDFEQEYVSRVYLNEDDRLKQPLFQTAKKVVVLACNDNLPVAKISAATHTLIEQWSQNAKAIYTLNEREVLILSDILLNTTPVEEAYRHVEKAYQAYLDNGGFAYGWTTDVPPPVNFKPSHLVLFYNNKDSIQNYFAFCTTCRDKEHSSTSLRIEELALSLLYKFFNNLASKKSTF